MWDDFPGEFGEAKILDDEGVDSGGADEAELCFGGGDFSGEDECVHGDEAFDTVFVEVGDELREVFCGEVVGAQAGVEFGESEVDGVCACGDGGACAVPVSGR